MARAAFKSNHNFFRKKAMSTTSTIFSQEEIGDLIELPEDAIVSGSDPFDVLTPSSAIWSVRRPEDFGANMSKAGIFHAYSTGQVGAVEAFYALVNYDLINWDDLMWMLSVQHRTARIIDGGAE